MDDKPGSDPVVTHSRDYSEFLRDLLPRLDLCNPDDLSQIQGILNEVKDFHANSIIASARLTSLKHEPSVFTAHPSEPDWLEHLKAQLLFSGSTLVEDPLLFCLEEFEVYARENTARGFDQGATVGRFRATLELAINQLYTLLAAIENGTVIPVSLFGSADQELRSHWSMDDIAPCQGQRIRDLLTRNEYEDFVFLMKNMEIYSLSKTHPPIAHINIPILNREINTVVDRPLKCSINRIEDVMGVSLREWIVLKQLKRFHRSLNGVRSSIRMCQNLNSTLWTPETEYWNAMRYLDHSPADSRTRAIEFLDRALVTDLSKSTIEQLMGLKQESEYFSRFIWDLRLAANKIAAEPGDNAFEEESESIFNDVFVPGIEQIESTINRNQRAEKLPKASLAVGLSFTSVMMSGGSALASSIAALSTGIGYLESSRRNAKSELSLDDASAYILWKIKRQPAS
jgi:hypothetical protein